MRVLAVLWLLPLVFGFHSVPLTHKWSVDSSGREAFVRALVDHSQHLRSVGTITNRKAKGSRGILLQKLQSEKEVDENPKSEALINAGSFFTGDLVVGSAEDGKDPQVFPVIFDTGSNSIAVLSAYADQVEDGQGFDPRISSTYVSQTPPEAAARGEYTAESLFYGSGTCTAVLGKDSVSIAGVPIEGVVFGQIVESDVDEFFSEDKFAGIVGISPPTMEVEEEDDEKDVEPSLLAVDIEKVRHHKHGHHVKKTAPDIDIKQTAIPQLLHDQGSLSDTMFSFYFSYREDKKGEMTLGGYDESKMDGDMKWLDIVLDVGENGAYWEVELENIKVGDKSLVACSEQKKCTAIIDTGTTLVVGPHENMVHFAKEVDVKADCSGIADLPDVTFTIGGEDFVITPKDYVVANSEFKNTGESPVVDVGGVIAALPEVKETAICASGFVSEESVSFARRVRSKRKHKHKEKTEGITDHVGQDGKQVFILGNMFLKPYVSAFDWDNKRIGLATAKHENDVPSDLPEQVMALQAQIDQSTQEQIEKMQAEGEKESADTSEEEESDPLGLGDLFGGEEEDEQSSGFQSDTGIIAADMNSPTEQETAPSNVKATAPTDAKKTAPTDAKTTAPTAAKAAAPTDAKATAPTDAKATAPTDAKATAPTDAKATAPTDVKATDAKATTPTNSK